MSRLERLIGIDAMVRAGGYPSLADFCTKYAMRERTIFDDLAYLRERVEAPLVYSRAKGGYYYRDTSWRLPTLQVSEGELLAFFLGVELARRYLGTSFEAPLRKALLDIARGLPEDVSIDMSVLASHYTFQPGATTSADPALLAELTRCIQEQWALEMTYYTASRGERSERVIEPYHLMNIRGDWHVVGFDHRRQAYRQFAVSRIEHWTVRRGKRFVRDSGFQVEQYLSTSFLAERGDEAVEVVIAFDADQAPYIRERVWHETQRIEEQPDGGLVLHFSSGALGEIRRWVLSYGRHARALAPADLVAAVAAELRAATQVYADEP